MTLLYSSILGGVSAAFDMIEGSKTWEQKIIDKWHQSKSMPRKKKKRVRKDLSFDYQICMYAKNQLGFGEFYQ
jgi:uncharacterized membrane protein YbaN (DUF454 family)